MTTTSAQNEVNGTGDGKQHSKTAKSDNDEVSCANCASFGDGESLGMGNYGIDFQAKDKSKKKKKKKDKRKTESKEGYLEAEGLSTPSKENLPPVKAATPTNNKLPVCKFRP